MKGQALPWSGLNLHSTTCVSPGGIVCSLGIHRNGADPSRFSRGSGSFWGFKEYVRGNTEVFVILSSFIDDLPLATCPRSNLPSSGSNSRVGETPSPRNCTLRVRPSCSQNNSSTSLRTPLLTGANCTKHTCGGDLGGSGRRAFLTLKGPTAFKPATFFTKSVVSSSDKFRSRNGNVFVWPTANCPKSNRSQSHHNMRSTAVVCTSNMRGGPQSCT